MKKFYIVLLTGILASSMGTNIFAHQNIANDEIIAIQEFAEENDITVEEVVNLSENLTDALRKAGEDGEVVLEENEKKVIPISENLVLEISIKQDGNSDLERNSLAKATQSYERTVTSTSELKNVLGGTIVTLNSVGVFETNGRTSKPIDAYGTYDAFVWNVTNTNSDLGSEQYNAWVKNSFSGELNIGIDPVDMTIQSFGTTCKIYCNAQGTYSASWS